MSDNGVEILLALERGKYKPLSKEEMEELVEFFCGPEDKEEEDADDRPNEAQPPNP